MSGYSFFYGPKVIFICMDIRKIIKEEITTIKLSHIIGDVLMEEIEKSDELKSMENTFTGLESCFQRSQLPSDYKNCSTTKLNSFYENLSQFLVDTDMSKWKKSNTLRTVIPTPPTEGFKDPAKVYKHFTKHLRYVHNLKSMAQNVRAEERGEVRSGKEIMEMSNPSGYIYHGSTVDNLTVDNLSIDSEGIKNNVLTRRKRSGWYTTFGFQTAASYAVRWFFESQGYDAREKYGKVGAKIWGSLDEDKKRHIITETMSEDSRQYGDEGNYIPTDNFLVALGALKSGKNPTVYKIKLAHSSKFMEGWDTVIEKERKWEGGRSQPISSFSEKDSYTSGGMDGLWIEKASGSPDGEIAILNKDVVESIEPIDYSDFSGKIEGPTSDKWATFNDAKKVLKYLG